jgi:hypothetical protein
MGVQGKEPSSSVGVAEVQGLYGAFSFSERLLQTIWQRGDFDPVGARLADGRELRVQHVGRWNHLGGPDFAGARLRMDGRDVVGDVELHLRESDWAAHRHAEDPAYANVVLHVVLFPCAEAVTRGVAGRDIPIFCLLPRLHRGLEEYAADDAVERLAGRPLHYALEALGGLGPDELDALLGDHAGRRWRAKVRSARERIDRLGWEGACHHAALEVLGYRFNRAPMLAVASAHPMAEWSAGLVAPDLVFSSHADRWSLQGVRPLNHPALRLRQYAAWCSARPDWSAWLRQGSFWSELAAGETRAGVGEWRRSVRLSAARESLQNTLCGGVIGGSRFDNLIGDAFLPLIEAEMGAALQAVWSGWYAGDAPESVVAVLRSLGVIGGAGRPVSQGPVQGLLGWMLERETVSGG